MSVSRARSLWTLTAAPYADLRGWSDNIFLDLHNSSDQNQPQPMIAKYNIVQLNKLAKLLSSSENSFSKINKVYWFIHF